MQRESMTIVTLWRNGLARQCHSEKEIEEATADGFVPYNPKDHEYPRTLYSGNLSLNVNSAGEAAPYLKDGWTLLPSAAYQPPTEAAAEPNAPQPLAPMTDTTALLSLISDLTNRVAVLEAAKTPVPAAEPEAAPSKKEQKG